MEHFNTLVNLGEGISTTITRKKPLSEISNILINIMTSSCYSGALAIGKYVDYDDDAEYDHYCVKTYKTDVIAPVGYVKISDAEYDFFIYIGKSTNVYPEIKTGDKLNIIDVSEENSNILTIMVVRGKPMKPFVVSKQSLASIVAKTPNNVVPVVVTTAVAKTATASINPIISGIINKFEDKSAYMMIKCVWARGGKSFNITLPTPYIRCGNKECSASTCMNISCTYHDATGMIDKFYRISDLDDDYVKNHPTDVNSYLRACARILYSNYVNYYDNNTEWDNNCIVNALKTIKPENPSFRIVG